MKDNFSKQSDGYAKFRPLYPKELYEFILSQVSSTESCWDCATGNGQAAGVLAEYFMNVYATDISQKQLHNATVKKNIKYSISSAEKTDFEDNFFDLITVAQAAHWFDFDLFYKEVKRVAKSNGIIAIWGYGLMQISPAIDDEVKIFYENVVGPYWDEERRYLDASYKTLPFPFEEIKTPLFSIKQTWNLNHLEGYLNTWSSVQKYINERKVNPVVGFMEELRENWKTEEVKEVSFPIFFKIARVKKD